MCSPSPCRDRHVMPCNANCAMCASTSKNGHSEAPASPRIRWRNTSVSSVFGRHFLRWTGITTRCPSGPALHSLRWATTTACSFRLIDWSTTDRHIQRLFERLFATCQKRALTTSGLVASADIGFCGTVACFRHKTVFRDDFVIWMQFQGIVFDAIVQFIAGLCHDVRMQQ